MRDQRTSRILRLAQIAPLWNSVPPKTYGGIERMIHYLTEELVRRGHDVTLFATGDSKTSARLKAEYPSALAAAMDNGKAYFYEGYLNSTIARAIQSDEPFDLIHYHIGSPAIPLGLLSKTPTLHTIHTGITLDDEWMFDRYPEVPVSGLTLQQLKTVPVVRRKKMRVIHYGFDFNLLRPTEEDRRYLVFLGRIAPHKAPHLAIQIAKEVHRPIIIAGSPLTAEDKDYFKKKIQPLIEGDQVQYIGPVNDDGKNQLFGKALALLFPIQWEEPFGLVMIEAMSCGVPVIACNKGSVPEIVDYGKTGFYANSPNELSSLVDEAIRLDRKVVREHAMGRFSSQRMADDYLSLYHEIIRHGESGGSGPRT
jgi:glycosyltransferase involved in cell wall biosynthesis